MLSVKTYNNKPIISFKNEEDKKVSGGEYYKTHAGWKTGVVVGGVSAASSLLLNNLVKSPTGVDKKLGILIPIGLAVYAGCGALVDKFINKKRENFAKNTAGADLKNAIKENKKAEVTRNGNVYYKSDIGKKYGAALGVFAYPLLTVSKSALRGNGVAPLAVLLLNACVGAIGGSILGSITDSFANKGAKKFADKADK
jgi:hypothetical protein